VTKALCFAAAAALLLLPSAPGLVRADSAEPFQMASVDQVEKMLGETDVVVFDVNTRDTFEKHHLRGARFVTSKTLAASLPQDKSLRLVFYCAGPT
jgi:rhodanese-related sulfurtransferase